MRAFTLPLTGSRPHSPQVKGAPLNRRLVTRPVILRLAL